VVAGFQVIIGGRFWVITEGDHPIPSLPVRSSGFVQLARSCCRSSSEMGDALFGGDVTDLAWRAGK
jgi:hypothetical protein